MIFLDIAIHFSTHHFSMKHLLWIKARSVGFPGRTWKCPWVMPLCNRASCFRELKSQVSKQTAVNKSLIFKLGLSAMYTHFPGMISRAYIRKVVHYFDWVSHVPELSELSDHDKVIE